MLLMHRDFLAAHSFVGKLASNCKGTVKSSATETTIHILDHQKAGQGALMLPSLHTLLTLQDHKMEDHAE